MAFTWEIDTENPPIIIGGNQAKITIEELEDGISQDPKVIYSGTVNMDKGNNIDEFKTAIQQVFKALKTEILTARTKRTRLAEIISNIDDSEFAAFETFLNQ